MGRIIYYAPHHPGYRVQVNGFVLEGCLLADTDGLAYALAFDTEGRPLSHPDGCPRIECYRGVVEILPPAPSRSHFA